MAICGYCGEEIEFRYIDGRNVPLHPSGDCSGWRYQSHEPGGATLPSSRDPADRASARWRCGHARSDSGVPITHPTTCPECHAFIFFHTNGNGDVVFFDPPLGPPWRKHPCLSSEEARIRASRSPDPMRIVELEAPPDVITVSHSAVRQSEWGTLPTWARALAGETVFGVVLRSTGRKVWRRNHETSQPSPVRLYATEICQDRDRILEVEIEADEAPAVGRMIRLTPSLAEFYGRPILHARGYGSVDAPDSVRRDEPPSGFQGP